MLTAQPDTRLVAQITACWPLPGVHAGSGLVWQGDHLIAIQDASFAAVRIDPHTRESTMLLLAEGGATLPKLSKPDFEAVFGDGDGKLYILGSGATALRRQIVKLDPLTGEATLYEDKALYAAIAQSLDATPNIEGAIVMDGVLRVFHREVAAHGAFNVTLDLPFTAAHGLTPRVVARERYDLGHIGPVPLGFTDAATLSAGRVMYLAVAENTPDAVADGPILGVVLGVIDPTGVRYTPVLELDGSHSTRKIEGLAIDPSGLGAYMITDPDDTDSPAELIQVSFQGPW